MQAKDAAVLRTLQRVQRFLDTNTDALGDTTYWGARQTLDLCVAKLAAHADAQAHAIRAVAAEGKKKRALRDALLINHMRPIAKIAAANCEQIPERIPQALSVSGTSPRNAVAAARAMADAVQPYVRVFFREGLAPGFVARLGAAADALECAITNQQASAAARSASSRAIDTAVAEGRVALAVLSAIVESGISDDAALTALWKTTKRYGANHA
jgi:hypothetical protein